MSQYNRVQLSQRDFLNTTDFTQEEVSDLIDLALAMKSGDVRKNLTGKTLAMLFFNPSLRTRVSFATAMFKLGGLALDISRQDAYTLEFQDNAVMDGTTMEHVKDMAGAALSRYCDAIAIRCSELVTTSAESVRVEPWSVLKQDKVLSSFAKYATVPVINMESNVYHPCQGLGDALTLKEKLGVTRGRKFVLTWAYHPKALPMAVPNSQMLAACDLGMEVVVAHPEGWDLDPEIVALSKQRASQAGGSLTIEHDQGRAFEDADVICAKSWGALQYYGNWEKEKHMKDNLKSWMVDEAKMKRTHQALFMHCLPVRRNVEVSDAVLDSPFSVIADEAENRMWAQMALLSSIMGE